MIFFATIIISMYVTIILIPFLNRVAVRINAMDLPNERKIHSVPKARTGGFAMAVGILLPLLLWAPSTAFFKAVVYGASIIIVFGILDDTKGLDFKIKFLGQIAAALVVILYGDVQIRSLGEALTQNTPLHAWVSIPLTLLVVIGVTNAINLSDGLDGLAGGVSLLIFILLAYMAYASSDMTCLLISISVIGAIFGFLRYNSFPSVVFMGDTGSQLLGFLAVNLSLCMTQGNTPLSPLLPLMILGFPILDTATVMLSRIKAGKSPFRADKRHFHHRLIGIGLYHSEAVLFIYLIQSVFVVSSFIFRYHSELFILCFYLAFSGIILLFFFTAYKTDWKLKRHQYFDKKVKGRLRVLKEKKLLIRTSFASVKILFPVLLISSCLIPEAMPIYFSTVSLVLLGIFLITWKIDKKWLETVSIVIIYFAIPVLIYFCESNPAPWLKAPVMGIRSVVFGFLLVSSYLTLRFTRRRDGFKTNPLDFLILLIVLIIPNLPDENIRSMGFGVSAIKIIVLYLGFEVLTGEIRNKTKTLGYMTFILLLTLSARGLSG